LACTSAQKALLFSEEISALVDSRNKFLEKGKELTGKIRERTLQSFPFVPSSRDHDRSALCIRRRILFLMKAISVISLRLINAWTITEFPQERAFVQIDDAQDKGLGRQLCTKRPWEKHHYRPRLRLKWRSKKMLRKLSSPTGQGEKNNQRNQCKCRNNHVSCCLTARHWPQLVVNTTSQGSSPNNNGLT
jgi:hypothetical protein